MFLFNGGFLSCSEDVHCWLLLKYVMEQLLANGLHVFKEKSSKREYTLPEF